ncbi:retrotransposon protein, putative, ty1-copia subclass [Tanacetum coccineum]
MRKPSLLSQTLSNRILIAIAAYYDYEIWQMDVKTAFLNGYLSKEVYMEQPEGFVNPKYPNRLRLSKSQSASTPAELKRMQNVPYASAVGSIMVMLLRCDLALMVVANRSEHYQAENTMGHEFATSSTETGYVVLFEWRCCSDLEESQAKSIFRYFILQKLSILLPYASKEAVWVKKIHILGSCFSTIEKPINMYLIITGAIAYSY